MAPKTFHKKTEKIEIRIERKKKNYLKGLAKRYGYKSLSAFLFDAAYNWRPNIWDKVDHSVFKK